MRPDDINPRTGLVVALVSVFLVFGFMFTVSGIKGETLGDIPLLAIGPAICLPGIAAIAWTRKTDGCTKWPEHRCCPPCACCCRKKTRDKDAALELLRTPSDLESGKGSCDQLASRVANGAAEASTGAAITTITNVLEGQGLAAPRAPQEQMLRYLENCYPEMPGNVFVAEAGPYSAFEEPREPPSVLEKRAAATTVVDEEEEEEDVVAVVAPSDAIIVCSYKDTTSPYDRYCCYVNPSEELCSDPEAAIV